MSLIRYSSFLPKTVIAGLALAFSHAMALANAPQGSIFDPDSGANNLGEWSFSSGTLTFNTDTLTLVHSVSGAVGSGYTDFSQSGNVQLAIFNFQSLSIGSGVTIQVTGSLGLVLASRTDLNFGAILDLSGGAATTVNGGAGASGAEGGVRNASQTNSAPPPADGGNGGNGKLLATGGVADNGVGVGAGSAGGNVDGDPFSNGGGGGSYGGVGGTGFKANTEGTAGAGGNTYGTQTLDDLYGGSGGGGGAKQSSTSGGGGGGGGGAVALIAEGTLTLSGQVTTKGGAGAVGSTTSNPTGGGGGSGGGILLAAETISLTGTLNVSGGDGGYVSASSTDRPGGSGGGGRVAIYADVLTGNAPVVGTNILTAGGTTQNATLGADGSYIRQDAPDYLAIPEPASAALFGLGALIIGARRRKVS